MKVFKRTLSVCVAFVLALSAIAAPITASATTPENVSGLTSVQTSNVSAETLHPFTSTEALIRDAIEELRAMEITHTEKEPDKALVSSVEKTTEMTYDAVKDTIATDLKEELSDGSIDVSEYGLSKENMTKLMDEILNENYLYNAVKDLRYTTENNKVTKVSFDVTDGYAAAMEAMENELTELDVEISVTPNAEAVLENDGDSISGHSLLLNADPNAACTMHTVSLSLLGDANRDGMVDVLDCVKLRNQIAEKKDEINGGDVNEDGVIDVLDVVFLRNAIAKDEIPTTGEPEIAFEWALDYNYDPVFRTDASGNWIDADGKVTQDPAAAILNGGLVYNPTTGEIMEGTLADVYYKLTKISFFCAECGQDIELVDNPDTEEDELANFSMTQDIWVNIKTGTTAAVDKGKQPTLGQGETMEDYILYTDMQIGTFMDDTFSIMIGPDGNPIVDPATGQPIPNMEMDANGQPVIDPATGQPKIIGLYTSEPQDNGSAEVSYYYSILSAFNADHAEYFGVSTDYWTSKNTEADPMVALKVLCNLDPNMQIPPAQMIQMVQMLPQAFMSYVYFFGAELLAMRDAAMAAVKALPAGSNDIHKMLVIHDWLAENAVFDMGSMLNVTGTGGNNDPIQMTTFGALLSNQLGTMQNSSYYGGICLAYAAAYTYLVQAAFPEIYTENGKWCTPAQVNAKGGDIVDFNQVMFYADTAETSIAGEGFGGGAFNNVHYFNAVKIKNAPTSNNADDKMVGNWFYVDACYDDIYVECISQYRVESEGAVNHSYFLVSPQTMGKMWAESIDYIDSLYDGYVYEVETDRQGNKVPSDNLPTDHKDYDPTHPNYVKVETRNETKNDNTCYEDSWFSGAVSKIYHDGRNWYYVDSGSNSATYGSMIGEDGSIDIDMDQMGQNGLDMTGMMHANRVDVEKQDKMKSRPMTAPDYWVDENDNQQNNNGFGSLDMETKNDPHATVIFDYGTGKVNNGSNVSNDLKAAIEEDFIYNDQYPSLTHAIAVVENTIYFNLGNQIWSMNKNNARNATLFREYHTIKANTDGRPFKGSSYTLADNGTALTVKNPPIAAMAFHNVYTPLYNYVDAEGVVVLNYNNQPSDAYMQKLMSGMTEAEMQAAIVGRVFDSMSAAPAVTVNLATNYSYTSAFTANMSDEQKSASIYTKEAKNLNPDYTQGISDDSVNDNEEFLWCANIREVTAQSSWSRNTAIGGGEAVSCSAKNSGHNYSYDSNQQAYLCSNCGLHAFNLIDSISNGTMTLTANVDSGISQGFIDQNQQQGGNQLSTTTTPVSPLREGATTQDEVVVTVTPNQGYGIPKVTYKEEGRNKRDVEIPMTQNEDGTYTGTITKSAASCLKVKATLSRTANVTVANADHGEVTVLTTVQVPNTEQGQNGTVALQIKEGETKATYNNDKLTIAVKPDAGYAVKSVKIGNADATKVDDNTYSYTLSNSNITVNVVFEKLHKVNITKPQNGTVTAKVGDKEVTEAFAGDTVTLTVTPATGYSLKKDSLKVTGANNSTVNVTAGQNDTYTFTMPAGDVNVTAAFEKVLTVTIDPAITNGEVTPDKPTAVQGDTVTLTVKAEEGYILKANSLKVNPANANVAIKAGATEGTYTFEMPNVNVTVTAEFEEELDVYTVTATAGANGDINPKSTTVTEGDPVTLTIAPAEGFVVDTLMVDGVNKASDITTANTYTFVPTANATVNVTFMLAESSNQGGSGEANGENQ